MPRTCRTCAHEARKVVELAAVCGAPLSAFSERHGLSPSSLRRHLAEHLPASLVAAETAR